MIWLESEGECLIIVNQQMRLISILASSFHLYMGVTGYIKKVRTAKAPGCWGQRHAYQSMLAGFSHCWFNKQQTVHSSLNNYNTKENNNKIKKKTLVKDPFSVVNKKVHFAFVRTVFCFFFQTNQKKPSQALRCPPSHPTFNLAEVATIQTLELLLGSLTEASGFVFCIFFYLELKKIILVLKRFDFFFLVLFSLLK